MLAYESLVWGLELFSHGGGGLKCWITERIRNTHRVVGRAWSVEHMRVVGRGWSVDHPADPSPNACSHQLGVPLVNGNTF